MRATRGLIGAGAALACVCAGPTLAQTPVPQSWIVDTATVRSSTAGPATVADLLTQLDRASRFAAEAPFGPAIDADAAFTDLSAGAFERREVWFDGGGHTDRLRLRTEGWLRRADGAPLPVRPLDPAALERQHYDLTYTRGWPATLGYTDSGLEVTLTPHAGFGVGSRGGTAEAGATLRIGPDLDRLVPDGADAFGERTRWYLYAAGSGRAVGYNFARDRDGGYARSGVSHDSGSFMGDASIGVALRRGAVQGSFGLVYREIETEGLRAGHGVDTDVSEGLVAFQLSIKPEW